MNTQFHRSEKFKREQKWNEQIENFSKKKSRSILFEQNEVKFWIDLKWSRWQQRWTTTTSNDDDKMLRNSTINNEPRKHFVIISKFIFKTNTFFLCDDHRFVCPSGRLSVCSVGRCKLCVSVCFFYYKSQNRQEIFYTNSWANSILLLFSLGFMRFFFLIGETEKSEMCSKENFGSRIFAAVRLSNRAKTEKRQRENKKKDMNQRKLRRWMWTT